VQHISLKRLYEMLTACVGKGLGISQEEREHVTQCSYCGNRLVRLELWVASIEYIVKHVDELPALTPEQEEKFIKIAEDFQKRLSQRSD